MLFMQYFLDNIKLLLIIFIIWVQNFIFNQCLSLSQVHIEFLDSSISISIALDLLFLYKLPAVGSLIVELI